MVERDFTVQAEALAAPERRAPDAAGRGSRGLTLPLAETHRRLMEQAEAAGLGDQDNSAILEVLRRLRAPA